jgi:hypothetical protein
MSRVFETGEDAYGEFDLYEANCSVCDRRALCVAYDKTPVLPAYKGTPINPARLKIGETHLCVSGGCYASAHRQVAHMVTENKYQKEG